MQLAMPLLVGSLLLLASCASQRESTSDTSRPPSELVAQTADGGAARALPLRVRMDGRIVPPTLFSVALDEDGRKPIAELVALVNELGIDRLTFTPAIPGLSSGERSSGKADLRLAVRADGTLEGTTTWRLPRTTFATVKVADEEGVAIRNASCAAGDDLDLDFVLLTGSQEGSAELNYVIPGTVLDLIVKAPGFRAERKSFVAAEGSVVSMTLDPAPKSKALRLLADGQPLANQEFELSRFFIKTRGRTDANGVILIEPSLWELDQIDIRSLPKGEASPLVGAVLAETIPYSVEGPRDVELTADQVETRTELGD